ncbi:PREDICTED: cytosol aminopeptidase-like [Papilio xuthus]|uniref:Cytosol aminopeptidase n=1 Tax=Papilio xuthus TaxID=66420 RepID=A0AAJ6ZU98_PAPXU|nr:PREDICTED: cytosol aminopeptidase-like [Papilio xuthus]
MYRISVLNLRKTNVFVRFISQFKIQRSDCISKINIQQLRDPKACAIRDKGLVLGVYYNDNVKEESVILTPSAQKYNDACGGKLWKQLKLAPIPRLGEARIFYDLDPQFAYVAVAGLGTECFSFNSLEQLDERKEAIRIAAGTGAKALNALRPTYIHVESFGNAEAAAEGANLAVWQFREYKSILNQKVIPNAKFVLHDNCDVEGWNIGQIKAESQNLARYLQEMPANYLNPTSFAKIAVDLLCELNINVQVKTQGWAASHEMGGFVAIGRSSIQPPLYVEISYYGANELQRPIVLIGKGVTFDSGSLDLKSPKDLQYMKGDMAGAACVLAIIRAVSMLKLPVNIRGILPLCELMPNGKSPKFGDLVNSGNGKSILIRLPSREGRLLVADSLVYARNYWPKFIIDIGTMSKELLHTLDGAACGCYTNSEELFCYLELASSQTGDRIWRMPLWKFYEDRIKDTNSADVANTAQHKYGDSPNCAAFLKQFVCDSQWIHLDTYNVAYSKGSDIPYLGRGMTGRPTRTIIEFLFQLIADTKL